MDGHTFSKARLGKRALAMASMNFMNPGTFIITFTSISCKGTSREAGKEAVG